MLRRITAILVLSIPFAASAQDSAVSIPVETREARHTNALELTVGMGSAQSYGYVASGGRNLEDLGVGLDASIGWRLNPHWMLGAYGTTALFPTGQSDRAAATSVSAGLQANYFFTGTRYTPWIGLGSGWRGYWPSRTGTQSAYMGLDIARLQVGIDVPLTPAVGISPMLGVTLSTLLSQENAAGWSNVASPTVSTSVIAGVVVRFDFLGHQPRIELAQR